LLPPYEALQRQGSNFTTKYLMAKLL